MKNRVINRINLVFALLIVSIVSSLSGSVQTALAQQAGITSTSVIQQIRDRGKLVAGVKYDFKPFGFLDEEGQVVGFDIDLIEAIAAEWEVEVEFVQVTSATRIPKLAAGEVDIVAASMTHKKERDATIDFSQTYFLDGQSLLVRRDARISGILDLDQKTVAAIQGSTSIDQIQVYADQNDVSIEILPFQEYTNALAALEAGQVDALTTDSVALSQFAKDNPELIVVGGLFTIEPYGLGLPAGDSYFKNLLDFSLQNLKEDGTYDRLYKKWFGDEAIPYEIEILPGEWPYTFATSPIDRVRPIQSKIDQILAEGKLVAGVKYDFEPFGFLNENDEVVGFDVDIMREFSRRWLGDANAVELVQVTSSNRIQKLAAGEVDILAASMTHKKERDELIDFSQTYFLDGQSLLVRTDDGIGGLVDLDGRTVAAIQGSTSIDNIRNEAIERSLDLEILPFQEYPPALEAVKAKQVDALTTDSVALAQFAKNDPALIVVGGRFTREPYGLGVPKYDHEFRDLANFTLQAMKEDGSYDAIYCRWFGAERPFNIEIWPGDPEDSLIQTLIKTDSPLVPDENCAANASAESSAPSQLELPTQYTIVDGDSLSLIAGRYYGDIFLWSVIYEANREIIGLDPDLVEVDTVLIIPVLP